MSWNPKARQRDRDTRIVQFTQYSGRVKTGRSVTQANISQKGQAENLKSKQAGRVGNRQIQTLE